MNRVRQMTDKKTVSKRPTGKRKPQDKGQKPKNDHTYEFQLLGLLGFTVLSAVSLHTDSVGVLGQALRQLYFGLFADAGYAMPYLILVTGFLALNRNLSKIRAKWILAAVLSMLAVILLVTLTQRAAMPAEYFTLDGLKEAHSAGVAGKGGGVVGTLLTGAFLSTIGVYGTYILVICLVLAILMLTTSFTLTGMGRAARDTAKKTGEVLVDANRSLMESIAQEPEEGSLVRKHHSIMKLMRQEQFDGKPVPEREPPLPERVPEVAPAEDPVEAALPFIINPNDQLEIPIIESTPVKAAKPKPEPRPKPAAPEASDDEAAALSIEVPEQAWPDYELPSTDILTPVPEDNSGQDKKEVLANARLLEETLGNFGIDAKVIQISRGPTITRYELQPSPGVKVSRIVSLSDDIALNLAAQQVRIVAPIPGKAAVGIEVPNKSISMVTLREVLESDGIMEAESKLAFSLGKDISGKPIVADLAKMPHLLVAGSTGSGKSVCINTIITSILFRARPDEVKFLMIDPKVVELNVYNGIPHLILPVVTDPKKASVALNWAVQEMTERYKLFAESGVRDITGYNRKLAAGKGAPMPKIVVIIDELADLMMVAPNAVEDAICRLAQMARAAGIHLIVATQRPSVDVITGVIKANIPSRIAFAVSSMMDSRTIIDMGGAEKLLGKGDMLYYPVGMPKPMRVQGSFVSDTEVEDLIAYIKGQAGEVSYNPEILDTVKTQEFNDEEADEFLEQAIEFVIATRQASASLLQRKFRIGYNRAARMVDSMEERGIIGPSLGSKPREVLVSAEEYENLFEEEEEV